VYEAGGSDWTVERGTGKAVEDGPLQDRIEPLRGEILRYVHRLTGDADAAEDVTQEALVRMLTADVDEMRNPRAWLYRVATNLVRDRARKLARERRLTEPIESSPPVRPDHEMERNQTVDRVRAVLDRLSPRDREMLILRESGFRHKEIAEVAGVQPQSMPVLAARAMARFRAAWLAEVGDESS
jgi:RNA polymerase sigma-70 factor (ECF subfamily)